jgi:hypothetical protein
VALNLWKIGGKPTSYNPLPTGYVNGVSLEIGDYVISFNAKSSSSGSLMLDRASQTGDTVISLTPDLKKYTVSLNIPTKQSLFLYSQGGATDIIIDSIELVQKPMPKLTVNGVDGFLSGKWTALTNGTVIDDSTLVTNAGGMYQGGVLTISILPNTVYTFQCSWIGADNVPRVQLLDVNNNDVGNPVNGGASGGYFVRTFTTSATAVFAKIYLQSSQAGLITYKNVMLNLGSTPAPYSRKTGDKMVLPVPKKNLFDNSWIQGGISYTTGYSVSSQRTPSFTTRVNNQNPIIVKPNTSYSIAIPTGYTLGIQQYTSDDIALNDSGWVNGSTVYTFTTLSTANHIYLVLRYTVETTFSFIDAKLVPIQLEEGTSATAYTPYAVQVNDLAKRYVPKKNFVSNAQGDWEIGSGDPNSNGDTTRIRMKNRFDVKVGNSYMISWNSTLYDVYLFESTGGAPLGWYMTSPVTFSAVSPQYRAVLRRKDLGQMAVSEINNVNLQIELGSTATSYEPYALTLPKARTGLTFNGVTDYVSLPYLTMDSIEIECLIDSIQPDTTPVIFHNSGGFGRVGGVNGGIISSITANGVNYVTNQIMFSNQRVKIVYKFSSSFTSTTNIFSSLSATQHVKGILYKVTCYLGGQVVAQYDFENASNIVGSNVLQSAQNLIPSFEDTRWSLHANTQVFGKDVLRLNASANFQYSYFDVFVNPSTSYTLQCDKLTGQLGSYLSYSFIDSGGSFGAVNNVYVSPRSIITSSNTQKIRIYLTNGGLGSFDFIKPQLYALSGAEGTIYGTPTSARKQSRRSQYAKR